MGNNSHSHCILTSAHQHDQVPLTCAYDIGNLGIFGAWACDITLFPCLQMVKLAFIISIALRLAIIIMWVSCIAV
jgi:hypothetical protein